MQTPCFRASVTIEVVKIRGVLKDGKIEAQIVEDPLTGPVTVYLAEQDGQVATKAVVNIGEIEKGENNFPKSVTNPLKYVTLLMSH